MSSTSKNYSYTSLFLMISFFCTSVLAQTSSDSEPTDVEIGTGGNIKLEKPYRSELEEKFEWHAHVHWESRYITEGRDNLSGKGIYSASSEFTFDNISVVPWVARSTNNNYTEFNLNIIYAARLSEQLEMFSAYNHIRAEDTGISATDNELSLDLVYFHHDLFQLTSTNYYSFDADGLFSEVILKQDYRLNNTSSINLIALIGFNFGYVTDGHKGINHSQVRANYTYQLQKNMELSLYGGYNLGINNDSVRYPGDSLLDDLFWGGAGMIYRF